MSQPSSIEVIEITGVAEDSRRVNPGDLFIARRGKQSDGAEFLNDAARRGAVAAIAAESIVNSPIPVIIVRDPGAAASIAAHILANRPSETVKVIGITGTNGKTTIAYLIQHILRTLGRRCGMIGTVQIDDGEKSSESTMTTPAAVDVADLLRRMRDNRCDACAMETSSHALDQGRVAGVTFAAGVFTNLTGDHLDYHGDVQAYAAAKARLFESLPPSSVAVVNADDANAARMIERTHARIVRFSFSTKREPTGYAGGPPTFTAQGSAMEITSPRGTTILKTPLVGAHNLSNALAAIAACCEVFDEPLERVAAALSDTAGAPGRLERVDAGQPFGVFVDYAHTDDALASVLATLRPICNGKLRVLFGCGGDRDRTKRPRMAAAAARYADAVTITSDNPRSEDPQTIIDEIFAGLPVETRRLTMIEPDRRAAIRAIIKSAQPADIVLLAGKGHEKYQIIGVEKFPFDDVAEARQAVISRG